jgi:hypothetical protein
MRQPVTLRLRAVVVAAEHLTATLVVDMSVAVADMPAAVAAAESVNLKLVNQATGSYQRRSKPAPPLLFCGRSRLSSRAERSGVEGPAVCDSSVHATAVRNTLRAATVIQRQPYA